MQKLKAIFTNKWFLIGVGVGSILVLAYGRFFAKAKPFANMLPGSDAKTGAPAA
jgi:hypothetical protein